MRRRPDYTVTVESEHNLITGIDWGGGEGHECHVAASVQYRLHRAAETAPGPALKT